MDIPDVIKLLLKDGEKVAFKPNDHIYITNERVIICPRRRGQVVDIEFDQFKDMNLKKEYSDRN
jgi:hypothetical protein